MFTHIQSSFCFFLSSLLSFRECFYHWQFNGKNVFVALHQFRHTICCGCLFLLNSCYFESHSIFHTSFFAFLSLFHSHFFCGYHSMQQIHFLILFYFNKVYVLCVVKYFRHVNVDNALVAA